MKGAPIHTVHAGVTPGASLPDKLEAKRNAMYPFGKPPEAPAFQTTLNGQPLTAKVLADDDSDLDLQEEQMEDKEGGLPHEE